MAILRPVTELSERVEFFPIQDRPLHELLGGNKSEIRFSLDSHQCLNGILKVRTSLSLGVGAFKTAHFGRLTLTPMAVSGLGQTAQEEVAVKRPYFKSKGGKVMRYVINDELRKVLVEANVMYWATSLLNFAQAFINRAIAASPTPPPFQVPQFRFVRSAVAITHDVVQGVTVSGATTMRAAYLLEELISMETDEEFVKYVHNGDATPLPDIEEVSAYELARFLCFIQHIQYQKTDGKVYISDFQGVWLC